MSMDAILKLCNKPSIKKNHDFKALPVSSSNVTSSEVSNTHDVEFIKFLSNNIIYMNK